MSLNETFLRRRGASLLISSGWIGLKRNRQKGSPAEGAQVGLLRIRFDEGRIKKWSIQDYKLDLFEKVTQYKSYSSQSYRPVKKKLAWTSNFDQLSRGTRVRAIFAHLRCIRRRRNWLRLDHTIGIGCEGESFWQDAWSISLPRN